MEPHGTYLINPCCCPLFGIHHHPQVHSRPRPCPDPVLAPTLTGMPCSTPACLRASRHRNRNGRQARSRLACLCRNAGKTEEEEATQAGGALLHCVSRRRKGASSPFCFIQAVSRRTTRYSTVPCRAERATRLLMCKLSDKGVVSFSEWPGKSVGLSSFFCITLTCSAYAIPSQARAAGQGSGSSDCRDESGIFERECVCPRPRSERRRGRPKLPQKRALVCSVPPTTHIKGRKSHSPGSTSPASCQAAAGPCHSRLSKTFFGDLHHYTVVTRLPGESGSSVSKRCDAT